MSKKYKKDQDLIKRYNDSTRAFLDLMKAADIKEVSHLSERAENIRLHPELLESIEETDPIWHELFDYVIDSCTPFTIEGEIPINEKIKIVRCWLPPGDPDSEICV